MPGEESNTNANVPMHPVGTGPDVLLEEDGTAGKDACIEEHGVPRGEMQEPGVSHLTTLEEAEFLTLSPPSHTTPEATSMQRSPAVNTMTPGISFNQTVARAWSRHTTPHRPLLPRLLGHSTHRPLTQGHQPAQIRRAAQTWCRRPHHDHQMSPLTRRSS
jgi:hypothetical protein